MNFLKKNLNGILVCFVIAVPSWLLGKTFPVVGGPVIAILADLFSVDEQRKSRIRNQMDF